MWAAIEADFHREYAVDVSLPGVLRSKTWRWFVVRLSNLSGEAVTRHVMKRHRGSTLGPKDTAAALRARR